MSKSKVRLIAIVGGSGSGKSCLADQLQRALGARAGRVSLDDFYRDRSHLPPGRRARINFDHPRAIDWEEFAHVLETLLQGKAASAPVYDFATHCRTPARREILPCPVFLVDGLWLLRKTTIRRMFDLSMYIACPARLRLSRRLARDTAARGRTRGSIARQFRMTVEPMHRAHVEPQGRRAHLQIKGTFDHREVAALAKAIDALASPGQA